MYSNPSSCFKEHPVHWNRLQHFDTKLEPKFFSRIVFETYLNNSKSRKCYKLHHIQGISKGMRRLAVENT